MQLMATPNALLSGEHSRLVGIRAAGLWMGATPEVWFAAKENNGSLSLAGTQVRRPNHEYAWHTKEIEEQALFHGIC